jgi:hypothetical protein
VRRKEIGGKISEIREGEEVFSGTEGLFSRIHGP